MSGYIESHGVTWMGRDDNGGRGGKGTAMRHHTYMSSSIHFLNE